MITILYGKKNNTFQKKLDMVLKGSSVADRESRVMKQENLESFWEELQTPSLFGERKTYIITECEDVEVRDALLEKIIDESSQLVHELVILLESVPIAWVRKLDGIATLHAIAAEKEKTAVFNAFSLANAFATGDKKKTWIAFQETIAHDDEMEKIHGMIWWKLKDMFLKEKFPQNLETLRGKARNLVHVYHDARKGGIGIKERLERFFLEM